jgi:hypothetical protein
MHVSERQLQELGVFVHGSLCALHLLGFVYNLRRRNRFDVIVHAAAALYDGHAVLVHLDAIKEAR